MHDQVILRQDEIKGPRNVVVRCGLPHGPEVRFIVEQGMEMGRPSRIYVEVRHQGEGIAGLRVGGQAVIVGEGTLFWDQCPAHIGPGVNVFPRDGAQGAYSR